MLIFIVPLQSPESSKSWAQVSRIARRTIHSLTSQICDEFRVILVCNQAPEGLEDHSHLQVIAEKFKVPEKREDRMRDKWIKVRRGLIEASRYPVTHVMIVDADDFVSNRLADLVKQNPMKSPGWIINQGYIYEEGSRVVFRTGFLNQICGSSGIIAVRRSELPSSMDGDFAHPILDHGHSVIEEYFRDLGRALTPVSFPAAIYLTGSGENDSTVSFSFWASRRKFVGRIFTIRPLTGRLRREFGIYP